MSRQNSKKIDIYMREQALSELFLDVLTCHDFSDTDAHSEKIVSYDESIRCCPNFSLTSISFDIVDIEKQQWLAFAFDFTFATLPEPGLNLCTGTDFLCPLIGLN